ncbi:43175_t:CDS:2 [Gigaspora margarita]|uniref:43175_t:CDS:1 n=1 Tax=Gigaspora margarita TaxID=4874 RepID=A0ABN7UDY4_GIGMA|nr:43175_t:CDS:2 [Gigaspora margarita]
MVIIEIEKINCTNYIKAQNCYFWIDIGFEIGSNNGEIKKYNYQKSANMDHADEIKTQKKKDEINIKAEYSNANGLENKFRNNSIQLKDQFQESIEEDSSENNDKKRITKKKLNHVSEENQTGDKESDDLPESEIESKDVTSEASEYMDITEFVTNETVDQLFNPGGSIFLKTKETKLESKTNSYLNPITYLMQHCPSLYMEA